MFRNTDEWEMEYKKQGALWVHDGNRKRPHALLTSGMHSNGFFNSRLIIGNSELLHNAAADLLELFEEQGGDFWQINGCVGPQTGATKLAQVGSSWVSEFARRPCFYASPAKQGEDADKSMVFSKAEQALLLGQSVLLWEDVLTTGGSVELTAESVVKAGGIVLPYILVLANRSSLQSVGGRRIIALIKRPMTNVAPSDCDLCKAGSEALRPKDNWERFNASY